MKTESIGDVTARTGKGLLIFFKVPASIVLHSLLSVSLA